MHLYIYYFKNVANDQSRWKDPRTLRSGGAHRSHMLRGLILRMGKIFLGRADVWQLLFCKMTTKKGRQKIEGQLL